jgi:hypothetical protein
MLALIGETFEYSGEITGCVYASRSRGPRIAVWLSNAKNETAVQSIGRQLKEVLNITVSTDVAFKPFYE